ncbi:MAG: MBL fold metallo-hydrolase [Thalassovita sp.]
MQDIAAFDPPVGPAIELQPGLRRILAPNASPMTFRGTNTYLLGDQQVAVIDPGPDSPEHLAAILGATDDGRRISHILITHAHLDHTPLAKPLSERTGAPVMAFGDAQSGRSPVMQRLAQQGLSDGGEGIDHAFAPDQILADKAWIETPEWRVQALWTPGHLGNHLCFVWDKVIFTGDLVMGWSTSLVSPPDGDLTDFMKSCRMLRQIPAQIYHPGHGAPIPNPTERLDWLIAHREARESQILQALSGAAATAREVATAVYHDTPPALMPAATRNVLAHLVDLYEQNRVFVVGQVTENSKFALK